jgi:hypothetical protein
VVIGVFSVISLPAEVCLWRTKEGVPFLRQGALTFRFRFAILFARILPPCFLPAPFADPHAFQSV